MGGITLLSLCAGFFDGLNVVFLFSVLNMVVGSGIEQSASSSLVRHVDLLIGFVPIEDKVVSGAVLLIISVILRGILTFSNEIFGLVAAYRIWFNVQRRIFSKFIQADWQFFLDSKQGELIFRLINAPSSVGALFKYVPNVATKVLSLIMVGLALVDISVYGSFGLLLLGVGYYYFTRYVAKDISYKIGQEMVTVGKMQNVLANEMISGIRQIKTNTSEKRWISEFSETLRLSFDLGKRNAIWRSLPQNLLETLVIVMMAALLIVVKIVNPSDLLSLLPVIGAFAFGIQKVMPAMTALGNLRIQLMGVMPTVEMVSADLNRQSNEIVDGSIVIDSSPEEISFENVEFSYPNGEKVLEKFTVVIQKGKTTAIVGLSGAGKSTITNLLVRLFLPQKGRILLDNSDLRDIKISSFMRKIGFVTQDTFIFHGTIAENIVFGEKDVDIGRVIDAAKIANAHDFVLKLRNGYDTVVGDQGFKLSGGQRQRIAIARAVLRNPEILILDEATSALDNISENDVQKALGEAGKRRTNIIIGHRLSTIENADKIVVLNRGNVVEEGTHEELLAKKGYYCELYESEKSEVKNSGPQHQCFK